MTGKLTRFSKSILQEPQLMEVSNFDYISEFINNHENYEKTSVAAQLAHDKMESSVSEDLAETTVGILRIEGALTYKPSGWEALCGGCSYVSLIEQTKELCQMDSVNTIMMDVNSGGGMSFRCFESAREIKKLTTEHGKKLIAYVDGLSASAAYALTAVADEVIVNPDSTVGSIGVVVQLTNNNEQMKEAGISTTYVTAGDSKVPFDQEGEFRADYISDIQERVTDLYGNFITHIAEARGISEETVRATEAKVFSAEKALELGLIDKIMEGEEFYSYLADLSSDEVEEEVKRSPANIIKLETDENSSNLNKSDLKDTLMTVEKTELSAEAVQLAELQTQMADFQAVKEQLAAYQAKEVEAAQAELSESLDKYSFLADSKDQALAFLSSGKVEKEHKEMLNTILASAQASNDAVKEEAAENISEAQLATEAAIEEKDKIKEEFGSKEIASTEVPEKELSVTETLKEKVAQKKAAKLAAKA